MLDYLRESADERAIRREHTKREKERRKRRIHKYGQMELKHSRRGCISCMLAVLSAFFLISIFSVSYLLCLPYPDSDGESKASKNAIKIT